ncbi:cyclophilin peptidyl-prolyl cis-trans isomerase Cyp8, partial [Teratosphaeriaceae sp. CCFEE 6253]
KRKQEAAEERKEELRLEGGAEDDRTTWTGKRVRKDGKVESGGGDAGVGRYLKQGAVGTKEAGDDKVVGEWDDGLMEPPSKKKKGG